MDFLMFQWARKNGWKHESVPRTRKAHNIAYPICLLLAPKSQHSNACAWQWQLCIDYSFMWTCESGACVWLQQGADQQWEAGNTRKWLAVAGWQFSQHFSLSVPLSLSPALDSNCVKFVSAELIWIITTTNLTLKRTAMTERNTVIPLACSECFNTYPKWWNRNAIQMCFPFTVKYSK